MKVIVPMAGRGSRFHGEAYQVPKPLIEIEGKPMLYWALNSLKGLTYSEIIFVCLKEHEEQFKVSNLIRKYDADAIIHFIDEVTEGQLCTVLSARDYFDKDESILIISSDTWVKGNLFEDIEAFADSDGLISVADLPGDRWSFAKTNNQGKVIEVAEKHRISDWASTGLYYFSSGRQLVHFGEQMIKNEERTRGEFYVIPVYQKMINEGMDIRISVADQMWDMGTPEAKLDFEAYLKSIELH